MLWEDAEGMSVWERLAIWTTSCRWFAQSVLVPGDEVVGVDVKSEDREAVTNSFGSSFVGAKQCASCVGSKEGSLNSI
jgi:hypothetical protein